MDSFQHRQEPSEKTVSDPQQVEMSPAIARMLEEVRNEADSSGGAYDRAHNRHNRGK